MSDEPLHLTALGCATPYPGAGAIGSGGSSAGHVQGHRIFDIEE
jgi:hypothetical protein